MNPETLYCRDEDIKEVPLVLHWFSYSHLSGAPREVSQLFSILATDLDIRLENGPEKSTSLRKLLEAKDAAVRAIIKPGG